MEFDKKSLSDANEALLKYQNILTAMALGVISKDTGREMISALNKARDEVRFGDSESNSR